MVVMSSYLWTMLRGDPWVFMACIAFLMGIVSCASPQPITGGTKDESPPSIIEEASTPNKQTNFKSKEIVLLFDEWVTLNDIYNQMVISPLMPDDPEITQKGKAIVIALPDSLRENTTYTMNFGNAITDLNEGNILENYVFVFSTGPELDSLSLNGIVTDAITLKPMEDVWVMLYPTGIDSAVYKRKPEYLGKTDITGKWSISYLRPDSFNVVALKDENVNFLYDQENEYFGWLDTPIHTAEVAGSLLEIRVFPREKRIGAQEVINFVPGWIKIIADLPFPKPAPQLLPPIDSTIYFWDTDTLHVWFHPSRNYSGNVIFEKDTTQVRVTSEKSLIDLPAPIKQVSGRISPGGVAIFASQVPLVQLDSTQIVLMLDSLERIPVSIYIDETDPRQFRIKALWTEEHRYELIFLPDAIKDYWGRTNDTTQHSTVVSGSDQYGELTVSIDSLDAAKQYVVFLKEGQQIVDTFVVANTASNKRVIRNLLPAAYTIEIIEDLNMNGAWDTGSYQDRRQPERKLIFIPEKLRAGWEQEVKVIWK